MYQAEVESFIFDEKEKHKVVGVKLKGNNETL